VNGTGNVLANDHDFDGDPLSVILVRAANVPPGAQEVPQYITNGEATAHGTYGNLVMHADGSYTYTPNAAYDALPEGQQVTDVFKYGVTDGNGGDAASYLTFTITGNNDAPVIDSYVGADSVPVSVFENITGPVAHVHATDADGPLLTYSISGDDAALFHVDSSTGDLSFIAAPDYEHALDVGGNNHYNVTITASDGTLFDTQSFDVEVKDVAETYSPVTVTNDNPYYAFSDNANAPAGQPVAIHFDADDIFGGGSDTFSYTFTQVYSNTSTNWLTVDPTNGTITGDPDHLSALTVYRIDATDAVTGHGSFTYVAFSALPDSGHYVSLTDSSSYGNASGSDVIEVAPGATPSGTISGGSASDVMIGNDEDNKFNGASESDTLYGNGGDDDLKNGSLQGFLSGGDGNDTLDAGSDPSYLLGGAGNDHLKGGHDDVLMGGDGNDTIIAGVGRNLIVGGAGNDTMTGGSGRDTYVFMESGDDNADIITNFNTTSGDTDKDVLDLSYLLDGINTDKASHVQLLYSDGSTHVLSASPTLPATNGDVTVQVNTSGSWENVVTLTDTGSNLPPSGVTHSAIQMMLDHATIQQFHT
jgi:VCBS repeat-containing protein